MSAPSMRALASNPARAADALLAPLAALVAGTLAVAAAWALALAAPARSQEGMGGPAQTAPIPSQEPLETVVRRCRAARASRDMGELRRLQDGLISQRRGEPDLAAVLATAEALLVCEAPDDALAVLARHSPAPGPDRQAWLLLQWRAADAGQDHERAARALRWMAAGDLARLESIRLTRQPAVEGGPAVTLPALDQLADHLTSLGRNEQAAAVLLAASTPGAPQARRWARAVALADGLDAPTREALLERALDQAAASGAWGLVAALLDQQLAFVESGAGSSLSPAAAQALRRRLRLSGRIDDAYGEWLLQRRFAVDPARAAELESQLRSPRDPGGHAAPPDPSTQP
ncbi:hypothetical protein [Cyanobium sp. NIES-981]|uniref:hypothetical protein n=1 Tax=Cyanobium sp. NIES-981 TaxID=1851505 RepID=UPI0007DD0C6A|nr:hypothetical protein [Cyanobium sp. NIES-981]SBO44481.1 conserved exported protein of unknown function [Cyanobium sp. NIES-981]